MGDPEGMMLQRPVKLACRDVWKLFGQGAERFLQGRAGAPSLAEIQGAGLVGAVRAADLEVGDGEIFVIMGLSGDRKSTRRTPVTTAHLVCRLLLEKKKNTIRTTS